jgi:brefeldin A-inhibited guanine nucleotide-exchange protein
LHLLLHCTFCLGCLSAPEQCVQHLVDLFGQFYGVMKPLLPRLLVLLRSFISRSHASLANVGVAAFTRLVGSCGKQLDADTWLEVCHWRDCH